MIIKLKDNNRTKYYQHTSNGRPILGAKGLAANFDRELGQKVLEHLRQLDHRFAEAELVSE